MGEHTTIQWTESTWNPIRGCSRVSTGCEHCYAESVAARFSGPGLPYEGLIQIGKQGPRWNGKVRFVDEHLADPLRWGKRRRIFVNSMSDLFHDGVSDEQISAIFGVMASASRHTFQVLTKRPERMREWVKGRTLRDVEDAASDALEAGRARGHARVWPSAGHGWPLPNVHLGVSVENQEAANARIPLLLETPAAVRWVSAEPLLGPVRLSAIARNTGGLDWVVVGGESGAAARPMSAAWARSLRDQCVAAGVPFFFKQWGEYAPRPDADDDLVHIGKKAAGREIDGRTWDEMPGATR